MKNLLLYDFLQAKGGAENLSLELCNSIPNMDLLIGYIENQNFPNVTIKNGRIISLGLSARHPVLQAIRVSQAFSNINLNLDKYHKVLHSGSYAPLAVMRRNHGNNYYYCHTPPRFVYDLQEHYALQVPAWQRFLFKLLIHWFQPQYEQAISKMDVMIANSENVKHRIKRYLDREAEVVFPPIDTKAFTWLGAGDYYLSTARLEPYKRVDIIVEAFMQMPDKKLIVASGGSQLDKLERIASGHSNITFTGWTTHQQLINLIGKALATIYIPKDEDFGMSPVESMSAGKPVFGVREGGVKETVKHGLTGVLLSENPSPSHLFEAIQGTSVSSLIDMKQACIEHSKQFDRSVFIQKMRKLMA